MIRLGLIGDNIAASRAPRLHELAGQLCGIALRYERLIPAREGLGFDDLFSRCAAGGYRGLNITYPYKEQVRTRLEVPEPLVRGLGACNTAIFGSAIPKGYNTDFSGFASAFRNRFPGAAPGRVAMAGAGGVGKAIGFALAGLGARSLAVFEPDQARAETLRKALEAHAPALELRLVARLEEALEGAEGLINATPLGMDGKPGSAFPEPLIRGKWAFDAVYTPEETAFLAAARQRGLAILSGWELFFFQGVDAFGLFTGLEVEPVALRKALRAEEGIAA